MALTFTVGGAQGIFEGPIAAEVASVLDHAFGAEGDWEGVPPRRFGHPGVVGWPELQAEALDEFPADDIPHLAAMAAASRGVYLPAHLEAVALPLSTCGTLQCASLPALREELAELARRWDLPIDDEGLNALIGAGPGGDVAHLAFAQLALAANEAVRRDCPLWVVG